jgi:hypothetical protein
LDSAKPKAIANGTREWFNDGDESGEVKNELQHNPGTNSTDEIHSQLY